MKVGVLALQGAFREHGAMLRRCGVDAPEVRRPEQMDDLQGLVIPGGESTAIGKLMVEYGFLPAIARRAGEGMALFGTCAGLILLAGRVSEGAARIGGRAQPLLGLMDITVRRNAFGRQRESFEADIPVPVLGPRPLRAVFIRAPLIDEVGPGVEVLARFDRQIVLARQGRCLVSSFHPELTDDLRLHRYFLEETIGADEEARPV